MDFIVFILLIIHFLYREYLLFKHKSANSRNNWRIFDLLAFAIAPIFQLCFQRFLMLDFLDNYTLKIIGLVIFCIGFVLSVWGKHTLSTSWATGWEYGIKDNHSLISNGPFKYFTHPIYIGVLFIAIGFELYISNAMFFIVLIIVCPLFYIQAKKEEKKLIAHFGEEYIRFKKTRLIL